MTDDRQPDEDIISAVLAEYGVARTNTDPPREYPLARAVPKPGDWCPHNQHVIDDRKRVVTCGKCGAPLDPITVLASYALDPSWVLECRKERKRLEMEIGVLRKEVHKLRAAKRRAAPETPEPRRRP